ncbi:hypothetical protein BFC21_23560 [Pseudomonas sp. TMW 2.1634]|nr:hypothetical protein BFC21_23560 [Pseudomonas sp. TMW 2.1634]
MTVHIHAIIHDAHPFSAQTRPLFITRRAACWQTDTPAGSENPVPGQARAFGELAQGAPNPARCSPKAGHSGQLTVSHDTTGGDHHQG